jgi:hypothetical protein
MLDEVSWDFGSFDWNLIGVWEGCLLVVGQNAGTLARS